MFAQSNGIEYFYNENTSPIAFAYLGEVYYYKKDLLGNVIEILDTTGTTVVKYTCDAWGNHKIVKDNSQFYLSFNRIDNNVDIICDAEIDNNIPKKALI